MAILRTLVDGLTAYAEDCNFNFNALNSESATTASTVSVLSSTVSGLSSTVSGHTSSIASLNSTVSGHTTSISNLTTQITQAMPVGTIMWFYQNSAPTGFLVCDGSAISRAQYQALYDKIGGYLPNFIDRFMKGAWAKGSYSDSLGLSIDGVDNHQHGYVAGDFVTTATGGAGAHGHSGSVAVKSLTALPCIKY